MNTTSELTGHCLCGACRFAITPPFRFVGHCHCESCRRQTASAFTTFVGVPAGQWRWTGETPAEYHSSPRVTRYFCPGCGAPLGYANADQPGAMDIYAALLDDPAAVTPTENYHWADRLGWALGAADLPEHQA